MASNISETPEESSPSWAMSAGDKPSGDREGLEWPRTQRINSSDTNSGDFLGLKGDSEMDENVGTDFQGNMGQMEGKPMPTASLPSSVVLAPVSSRRHPSGDTPSLVLS